VLHSHSKPNLITVNA